MGRSRECRGSVMRKNGHLQSAKHSKYDEFYTQRSDIENELRHYKHHFRGKTVYCNCDDPRTSNFFHYFAYNFARLGLKKLVTTCYKNQNPDLFSRHDCERAIRLEYDGYREGESVPNVEDIGISHLAGDGDFRSPECIDILKQADIVVTNPPFSLFREYIAQLMEHEKKFIIIGPWNAVIYTEIFPLIMKDRLWLGYGFASGNAYFAVPPDLAKEFATGVYDANTGLVKFRNVTWFTNLDHAKRREEMILWRKYTPSEYPKYDNYDAIEVSKISNIPKDWDGVMGVPVRWTRKTGQVVKWESCF